MDYGKIKEAAQGYEQAMTKFLRDLVRIPGESVGEEGHVKRIEQEMNALGFDKVVIDPMGNILGYMGSGKTLIGFDAHIDTNPTRRLAAAVPLTSSAALSPLCTAPRS